MMRGHAHATQTKCRIDGRIRRRAHLDEDATGFSIAEATMARLAHF